METANAPTLMEEKMLLASVTLITDKLERVKQYLVKKYSVNGRLGVEGQHALRVIDSRKRELQRILLTRTRPASDRERQMAEAELGMKHRDLGDSFRWRTSHGFGRLGCPGCEYDYKNDATLRTPVKVVLARVCPKCHAGVMHSQIVESAAEALGGVAAFREVCGLAPEAGTRPEVPELQESAILMACEACGEWELRPCSAF
jgi:hypothetical protein